MALAKKSVVIVGGGFCGTLCAVHLLRAGSAGVGGIVLIDDGPRIARGMAYSTAEPLHLLNVPAGRMSAFPDEPEHFLCFAQSLDDAVRSGDFLPRKIYGDYLEAVLRDAQRNAVHSGVEFLQVADRVVDIAPLPAGGWLVSLQGGSELTADRVILASGNGAPRAPSAAGKNLRDINLVGSRYIDNPWARDALSAVDFEQPALLIGAGLTAVDVVTTLRARGFQKPLHALSRHGLLPLAHRGLSHARQEVRLPAELRTASTPAQFLRRLRTYIGAAKSDAIDWRDVLTALRKETPAIWQSFDIRQRAGFLRHGQTYWDVHRHRIAPRVAAQIAELIATGQLQIHAGRVVDFDGNSPESLHIYFRRRASTGHERLAVGTVINCTGPASAITLSAEPLWRALLQRGLVRADALNIGIDVADDYSVIGADGGEQEGLYYVGPLLKAGRWEATAVPELREHVVWLVQQLCENE